MPITSALVGFFALPLTWFQAWLWSKHSLLSWTSTLLTQFSFQDIDASSMHTLPLKNVLFWLAIFLSFFLFLKNNISFSPSLFLLLLTVKLEPSQKSVQSLFVLVLLSLHVSHSHARHASNCLNIFNNWDASPSGIKERQSHLEKSLSSEREKDPLQSRNLTCKGIFLFYSIIMLRFFSTTIYTLKNNWVGCFYQTLTFFWNK